MILIRGFAALLVGMGIVLGLRVLVADRSDSWGACRDSLLVD